jgi:hypothetical protein
MPSLHACSVFQPLCVLLVTAGESFLSAHLSDVPHAQPTRTFHFNQKVTITTLRGCWVPLTCNHRSLQPSFSN